MDYVPVLFISAKTGQRVDQVLPMALRVQEQRLLHLPTSQLNQIFQKAQSVQPGPSRAGKQLKIYYSTQVRSDPPTFLLYVNDPKLAHFSYLRYLENRIRESSQLPGHTHPPGHPRQELRFLSVSTQTSDLPAGMP